MVDNVNVPDDDAVAADESEAVSAAAHEARLQYETERGLYEDFARSVASVLEAVLKDKHIKSQSITSRAKDPDEFERKAARPGPGDTSAKYSDPLAQITDKAGVRVITYAGARGGRAGVRLGVPVARSSGARRVTWWAQCRRGPAFVRGSIRPYEHRCPRIRARTWGVAGSGGFASCQFRGLRVPI